MIPLSTPIKAPGGGPPLTSVRVRAGQVFHIPFTTMHLSPAAFGPDAAAFNPARWLSPSSPSSHSSSSPSSATTTTSP